MNKKKVKKAIASVTTTAVAGFTALSAFTFYQVFDNKGKLLGAIDKAGKKKAADPNQPKDQRSVWNGQQEYEKCYITDGDNRKLCGHYLPAEKETKVFVLGSHGYRSRGKGEFRFAAKFLHEHGFNLFLIDHPGAGESEGKHISFGFNESKGLLLWIDYLKERFGDDIQIILYGVSMGSASVMMLSDNEAILPNVKFIIADCGYTSVEDQFKSVLSYAKIPTAPLIKSVSTINKFVQGFNFEDVRPIDHVKKAIVPMLFVHGEKDKFVPTKMVYELYDACPTHKDLFVAPDSGHAASYRKHEEEYSAKIIEFENQFITCTEE